MLQLINCLHNRNEDEDFFHPATPNLRSRRLMLKFSINNSSTKPQSKDDVENPNQKPHNSFFDRTGRLVSGPQKAFSSSVRNIMKAPFQRLHRDTCYWSFSRRHHDLALSRKISQFFHHTFCLFYCIDRISPLCLLI